MKNKAILELSFLETTAFWFPRMFNLSYMSDYR
jgi:hypothetical protein